VVIAAADRRRRPRAHACWQGVALIATALLAPRPGLALPIEGGSVDLGRPEILFLDFAADTGFTAEITGSFVDQTALFEGLPGQKLHFEVDVTIDVPAPFENVFEGGLLVFTSIRVRNTSDLVCPNYPPRLPLTLTSLSGDTLEATDPTAPAGNLCDGEDELNGFAPPFGEGVQFLAFQFAGSPGDSHHVSFDAEVNRPFTEAEIDAFYGTGIILTNRGFAITPEPASLLLVLAGLAAIAGTRRGSRRR